MRRNHRAAPRTMPAYPTEEVAIELPPAVPGMSTQPRWILVLQGVGMIVGIILTLAYAGIITLPGMQNRNATGDSSSNYMALAGVFMMFASIGSVINQLFEPRRRAKQMEQRSTDYRNYLNDTVVFIDTLAETQRREHEAVHPSIDECMNICASPQLQHPAPRMWERWRTGNTAVDFLHCRVGLGRIPATYRVRAASTPTRTLQNDPLVKEMMNLVNAGKTVPGAPVTVPLPEIGVLGIHGDGADNILRVLLVHLVTHHSPADVTLSLLASERQISQWLWSRWLPHIWGENNNRRLLGSTVDEAQHQIGLLIKMVQMRTEQARETNNKYHGPAHVAVFVDADVFYHREDMFRQFLFLLNNGPQVAVYIVILSAQQLPRECRGVIEIQSISARYLENVTAKEVVFTPDQIAVADVERLARALAPWESTSLTADTSIPERVSLMDLLGVNSIEKFPMLERWQRNKPWDTLAVPIGLGPGRMPVQLDVQKHGPHGLGAGTTGSGKSELLLTYIAMLAANYHPSELIFMLIDFKGEGMSRRVANLPHLAGVLSNLAASQTGRILVSLNAELNRRQRLFKEYGITDINEYLSKRRSNTKMPVMPMMLIIADEFAQLKDEQPEFIDQLVGAARIGRSLGIRLLLTTQNPSGVVTKQIATNTSYRFCLKVASRDDSMDLIGISDAAYLPGRGAGFLKMGEGQPIQFQSGFTGDQYATVAVEAPVINSIAIDGKRQQMVGPRLTLTDYTQLDYLVNHIEAMATSTGYTTRYRVWAPALPEEPPLLETIIEGSKFQFSWNGTNWTTAPDDINIAVGLYDDPANQAQNIFSVPVTERNNIAVLVGAGEGRNLFSRTFVGALVQTHAPRDVQLLLLDFSAGGSLKVFEELPHTIALATPHTSEIINRVNTRLNDELSQRARTLAGLTFASYRATAVNPLPRIVILIDNAIELRDSPVAKQLFETIERVAQNGPQLGIHLVILMNAMRETSLKINQQYGMTIGIGVNQDTVYDISNRRGMIIDTDVLGRGVASIPACEIQIAAIAEDGEIGQMDRIHELIDQMNALDGIERTHQIREVPERLPVSVIQRYTATRSTNPFDLCLALNTETEAPEVITFGSPSNVLFVIGSPRSGKSTLVQTVLSELNQSLAATRLKYYMISVGNTQLFHFQHDDRTQSYETSHSKWKSLIDTIEVALEPHRKLQQNELENGNVLSRSQILERLPAICIVIDTDRWNDIVGLPLELKTQFIGLIQNHRDLGLFVLIAADLDGARGAKSSCDLTLYLFKQPMVVMNPRDESELQLLTTGMLSSTEKDAIRNGMRPGRGVILRQSGRTRVQFGLPE